jgi:hypothetical protein
VNTKKRHSLIEIEAQFRNQNLENNKLVANSLDEKIQPNEETNNKQNAKVDQPPVEIIEITTVIPCENDQKQINLEAREIKNDDDVSEQRKTESGNQINLYIESNIKCLSDNNSEFSYNCEIKFDSILILIVESSRANIVAAEEVYRKENSILESFQENLLPEEKSIKEIKSYRSKISNISKVSDVVKTEVFHKNDNTISISNALINEKININHKFNDLQFDKVVDNYQIGSSRSKVLIPKENLKILQNRILELEFENLSRSQIGNSTSMIEGGKDLKDNMSKNLDKTFNNSFIDLKIRNFDINLSVKRELIIKAKIDSIKKEAANKITFSDLKPERLKFNNAVSVSQNTTEKYKQILENVKIENKSQEIQENLQNKNRIIIKDTTASSNKLTSPMKKITNEKKYFENLPESSMEKVNKLLENFDNLINDRKNSENSDVLGNQNKLENQEKTLVKNGRPSSKFKYENEE